MSYFDTPLRPANPEPPSPKSPPKSPKSPLRPALKRFPSQSYEEETKHNSHLRPAICRAISEPYRRKDEPKIVTEAQWVEALAARARLEDELRGLRVRFESEPEKAPQSGPSKREARLEGLKAKAAKIREKLGKALGKAFRRYTAPKP